MRYTPCVIATVALSTTVIPDHGTAASNAQAVVRDSAGIRIVENRAATAARSFRLGAPVLTIGNQSGAAAFTLFRVRDAGSLSDGGVAVVNGLEILLFAPDGRLRAKAGGAGDGPSEFRDIAGFAVLGGDTIAVVNRWPPTVKYFGLNGRHIASVPFTSRESPALTYHAIAGGSWTGLSFAGEKTPATPALFREDWLLVTRSTRSARPDTFAAVNGETYYGDRRASVRVRGSPRAHVAARNDRIAVASSGAYELRVHDVSGRLTLIIRNALPNPSISTVPVAQSRPPTGRVSETGATAPALNAPSAASAPAFHDLLLAEDNSLWVRRSQADAPSAEWHVYDARGNWTATATLPGKLRPTEVSESHLLGILKDDLDVEYVVKYLLPR